MVKMTSISVASPEADVCPIEVRRPPLELADRRGYHAHGKDRVAEYLADTGRTPAGPHDLAERMKRLQPVKQYEAADQTA